LNETRTKRFPLRVALSILLISLLFVYVIDARELVRILRQFDPVYLLLAIAAVTLDRILMTYKWLLLLRAQGYRLPLWRGVAIYCSSMVWGMALPTTVGADAIRATMVARRGISGTDVVASILVERMVGFVLAIALGLVSLVILRCLDVLSATYNVALWLGAAALLGAIGLVAASMNAPLVAWAVTRLPRGVRESKVMGYLTRFTAAYQSLGGARTTLAQFGALTVAEQLVAILFPWMLALGLGVPADLLLLLGVLPISTLLSRLPISFDGLGVYESIFVGLMMLAGISGEAALAIAISGRVIQFVAFLPWWFAHVTSTGVLSPPRPA
jgi:glycosyltransferase 2 family protein